MASLYLILALLIQCSLIYADIQSNRNETDSVEIISKAIENSSHMNGAELDKLENKSGEEVSKERHEISKVDREDVLIKDFEPATNDWLGAFLESNSNSYPSSSASIMAQVLNANKTAEEQLKEIKKAASEMTLAIESDVNTLLSHASIFINNEQEDTNLRKKRSVETPMDSSQLVMRLLKHIKTNNEYQNIAIEKMMSAQEIADKYGVEFNPDPEILTDLAFAANEHAKELTSILKDACDIKANSCAITTTENNNEINQPELTFSDSNSTGFAFSSEDPACEVEITRNSNGTSKGHDHFIQSKNTVPASHVHFIDNHSGYNYYSYPYETQITPPPVQNSYGPSVSAKPTFYDPNEYYLPYCSMDQMAYPPLHPLEEPLNLEPELVGEEYEETISSRVIIEQDDEPGSATVNHVMTYTVSEKAHFKSPQIEKLPQQVQYYFLLM